MSAGATLLKLQQIDLELARNKSELANMPELKELASKRKTYVKLKSEMTKLYAQRKDLDIELDDLNTTEIQTNNAIEAAKKRHVDGSDYREVQDLENELATLAKRLDKIEHTRKDVVIAHKEALDREARAQAIIAKFEEGVKADTKAARAKAADLQAQIDAATKERTALAACGLCPPSSSMSPGSSSIRAGILARSMPIAMCAGVTPAQVSASIAVSAFVTW